MIFDRIAGATTKVAHMGGDTFLFVKNLSGVVIVLDFYMVPNEALPYAVVILIDTLKDLCNLLNLSAFVVSDLLWLGR